MYTCFKCLHRIDGDLKKYCLHLKYRHFIHEGTRIKIICGQDGCQSIFLRLCSLKRHLRTKHTGPRGATDNPPEAAHDENILQEQEEDPPEDLHHFSENENMDDCGNPVHSFAAIKESISLFVAKLKINTSIADSFVDDILKEFSDMTQAMVYSFREKLLSLKEFEPTAGPHFQEKLDQHLIDLSHLSEPFAGLMTEHQRKDFFTKQVAF